ncbi:hypothetical protein B0J12DRAFT_704665 [Macrophomina phaseolina]|uniref:Uncharacterized protein n=1 Tax=Macrophomina phaseolina TaxID=35725 RepID=A0ABQ8FUG7_9PEZI|nr:hypothetical protein B0J12DRAFT_704665 [Macrophomina phaseolina]
MPRVISDENIASKRPSLERRVEHILNGGSASDKRVLNLFAEPGPSSAQGGADTGGPRRQWSCRRNDLAPSIDAQERPAPGAHPKSRADEQKTKKMKGFGAWNLGGDTRKRLMTRRYDTLHMRIVCNMEHSRERSRVERDEKLHLGKRSEKGREGWAKRDERIQAIFQWLDSELERAAGTALPRR